MYKSEFLGQVMVELNTIKERATAEEINKLDFSTFAHDEFNNCIYGQMTGHCNSDRAVKLYRKSYDWISKDDFDACGFEEQSYEVGCSYTPLEKYLFMCDSSTQERIILYLKGLIDIKELKLKL